MANKNSPVWIWNQLMRLSIIVIGILPLLSSRLVAAENRPIILALTGGILIVSALGEIWHPRLAKKKVDINKIIKVQVLAHFVLLTLFIRFYGQINSPLFLLYLPVVMEAFLSRNIFMGNLIVIATISFTSLEYVWLLSQDQMFGLFFYIEFMMRILALVFVRAYGLFLTKELIIQEETRTKAHETTSKLEQITRDLKKANVKLKELSVLKDEFVSVASHELRAPMTAIKGYLALVLEGDAGKIPPKVKEFLQDAFNANDRMIRLINNMLNVSRIESGRMVMNLKDIQIEKIIKLVVKEFRLEAEKHGLGLEYRKPAKELPKVRVDPDRIREIVANLVGNAINFTPHGAVVVESKAKDGMVVVGVKDTGVGISKENQKELFEKFSQVDGADAPLKKGSGLGLYICKMLLNEFGGKIWLKSKKGQGTIFYFSLPAISE